MGVITRVQLLEGTAPLKFGSAKNAQNSICLTTTFDFERKYLNCIGISTSGKRRYQIQLIPRWIKKLCELQSTNIRDYAANVYPPKSNFSEGHISALRGCCAPKFLQVKKWKVMKNLVLPDAVFGGAKCCLKIHLWLGLCHWPTESLQHILVGLKWFYF